MGSHFAPDRVSVKGLWQRGKAPAARSVMHCVKPVWLLEPRRHFN
jgi:hypothetical protein